VLVPLTILNTIFRYETTFKGDQSLIHSLYTLNGFEKVLTGLSGGIVFELLSTKDVKRLTYRVPSPCLCACHLTRTCAVQIPF
jgi:hypothetical protein